MVPQQARRAATLLPDLLPRMPVRKVFRGTTISALTPIMIRVFTAGRTFGSTSPLPRGHIGVFFRQLRRRPRRPYHAVVLSHLLRIVRAGLFDHASCETFYAALFISLGSDLLACVSPSVPFCTCLSPLIERRFNVAGVTARSGDAF